MEQKTQVIIFLSNTIRVRTETQMAVHPDLKQHTAYKHLKPPAQISQQILRNQRLHTIVVTSKNAYMYVGRCTWFTVLSKYAVF